MKFCRISASLSHNDLIRNMIYASIWELLAKKLLNATIECASGGERVRLKYWSAGEESEGDSNILSNPYRKREGIIRVRLHLFHRPLKRCERNVAFKRILMGCASRDCVSLVLYGTSYNAICLPLNMKYQSSSWELHKVYPFTRATYMNYSVET